MELKRKMNNYKSADLNCYDLNEYCTKVLVNDFGINTSKNIIEEIDNSIYENPKKLYNQKYLYDEDY